MSGKGFVICTEMRKCFPDTKRRELKTHLIGGKLERGETPLTAACREFCEELPFDYPYQDLESAIKDGEMFFYDITVSKQKNLENRFIVFSVDSIPYAPIRNALYSIVEDFNPEVSALVSLEYWNGVSRLSNLSSLFQQFNKECKMDSEFISECRFDRFEHVEEEIDLITKSVVKSDTVEDEELPNLDILTIS